MYSSRLTVSSWQGIKRVDEVIEEPDLEAIKLAVHKLDGTYTTEMTIEGEANKYLIIGGGSGSYVGFIAHGDTEFHNLINPTGSTEHQIELCVGGQTGYYTKRQCVDLETAIQAAQTFAKCGDIDKAATWELQK